MDPTLIGLLGSAALSSAASMANNAANIRYASEANEESVNLANTAHQREVRDLLAAGLNPILSASSNGAATPTLKTPNLESIDGGIGNSAGAIARALNGQMASEAKIAAADASSAEAEKKMTQNEKEVNDLETELERAQLAAQLQALSPNTAYVGDDAFKYDSPNWWTMVDSEELKFDAAKAAIQRGRYLNSRGHAIFEDILNSAGMLMGISREARGWTDSVYDHKPVRQKFRDWRGREARSIKWR